MSAGSKAVKIVALSPADALRMRGVRLRALQDSPTAFGSSYEEESRRDEAQWRQRAEAWADPAKARIFLATLNGQDVGLVGGFRDKDGRSIAWLVAMWVAPEARRLGAGQALIQRVLTWAKRLGLAQVRLHVTQGNDPALRLYEATGFQPTGDRIPHPRFPELCENEMAYDFSREITQ